MTRPSSRIDLGCALALVALVAFAYWPGTHAFWGRDDYGVLAFVRELGNPWPLFVQDHHAAPATLFRPLGYFSYWLGVRWLGIEYFPHALCELALHAANALALFALLRRARCASAPALLGAALFALHPAALGAALWFAARFDLLATLFVLLALHGALAYRQSAHWRALAATWLCALLAMLSKEIGLLAAAAATLLWLEWAWSDPRHRVRACTAIALMVGCVAVFLFWRAAVLGTFASRFTGDTDMAAAVRLGLGNWLQQCAGYLAFWAPGATFAHAAVAAAAALAGALAFAAPRVSRPHAVLVGCGLCLFLLPALLQAPAEASALPVSALVSDIERAMQSRLYYLGLAGVCLCVGALLDAAFAQRRMTLIAACASALLIGGFGLQSRGIAQRFAQRAWEISAVARAATEAVGKLELPKHACHLAFLDVQPPPEWDRFVSMDAIVKALAPDNARVRHCWIHSDYFTGVNLMAAPADARDALPYLPLAVEGHVLPWRQIGGVVLAYVRAPHAFAAQELAGTTVLRWQAPAFVAVDASTLVGRELHLQ